MNMIDAQTIIYQWAASSKGGPAAMRSRSALEADGFHACVRDGREVSEYGSVLMKRAGQLSLLDGLEVTT
jgi:hypothetical protein